MNTDFILDPWMKKLLRFAACFNVLAGLCMLFFYHEGFKHLRIPKPALALPVQLVGIMVVLFGFGYWMVANRPVENRDLLLLGMLSKALGSALVIYHFSKGELPWLMLPIVFFADVIYVVPFWMIWQRLKRAAARQT